MRHKNIIRKYIIKPIALIGVVILVMIMLLSVTNVALRYIFNSPILGDAEIIEAGMVALCFLVMCWTTYEKGHIKVDSIISRFPNHMQKIINIIFHVLYLVLFIPITWSFITEIIYRFQIMEKTLILNIPIYSIYCIAVVGLFLLCLVLIIQLIELITEVKHGH